MMIDGINQLPAPLPILPKGHYLRAAAPAADPGKKKRGC